MSDLSGTILISIGTSLIASGIIVLLDIIREILNDNIIIRINNIFYQAGLVKIYSKRDIDDYDKLMNNLKHNLKVTGYSLRSFFDSFEGLIKEKSKAGIKIYLLVTDPNSEFAKNREEIEGNREGTFKDSLDKIYNRIKDTSIEMRKINMPLTTMIFKIDETMYVGPHLFKKASKATHTFELTSSGELFKEYEDEFDKLWNSGEKYYYP
jgi:predicted transcriptional regulator